VLQERIKTNRQGNRGERPGPASAHRIRHGHAHARSLGELVLFEVAYKFFEIRDRDSSGCATARKPREIRRVQAEFRHASLHPRRHVACARRVGRHRQSANGRLDHFSRRLNVFLFPGRRLSVVVKLFRDGLQAHARRFLRAGFEKADHAAYGVALVQARGKFINRAAARRSHIHRRLAGLHFYDVLVGLDRIARFDEKIQNGGLGNRLAKLRHDEGYGRHAQVDSVV